jgi:tetratricopeptide (TPR) repeat protein
VFWFCLGLMSKPMLVTVPFVLLLLDYWPLRRLTAPRGDAAGSSLSRGVVLEKLPLLAIATVVSVVTVVVQGAAIQTGNEIPFGARVANAGVSYIAYIRQMLAPFGLAVFYPYPKNGWPVWQVIGAFAVLILITAAALVARRRCPYLLVGWLWYLGMLVPVIGLVQSGLQARADRFTYLPEIGLIIAVAWWATDFSAELRNRSVVLRVAAACVILIWSALAFVQTRHWRSSGWLFDHALACTEDNAVAHRLFANALAEEGQFEAASEQFRKALNIRPRYANALCDYGMLLFRQDVAERGVNQRQRLGEAASRLRAGLAIDPTNLPALITLASVWLRLGELNEVEPLLNRAIDLDQQSAAAYVVLGELRLKQGKQEDALVCYRRAVSIDPEDADRHVQLAIAYYKSKKPGEALAEIRESVRLAPNNINVLYAAARMAATSEYPEARSGQEAVDWATRAADLCKRQIPDVLDALAASYAEVGRRDDAVRTGQQALKLAEEKRASIAESIRAHLKVYASGAPLRDSLEDLQ